MIISLICDNENSWIIPYLIKLNEDLIKSKHNSKIIYSYKEIEKGDLAFFLGCESIINPNILKLNSQNIVVHESNLPEGKGWSPMTWQVLEGKDIITITLFEAIDKVDSGDIYLQDEIKLEGHEIFSEIKQLQGKHTIKLIKEFINKYPNIKARKQSGKESYYPKRTCDDSVLDIDKTIREQFNLLRVVDNENYPAFFYKDGFKYIIKVFKE